MEEGERVVGHYSDDAQRTRAVLHDDGQQRIPASSLQYGIGIALHVLCTPQNNVYTCVHRWADCSCLTTI